LKLQTSEKIAIADISLKSFGNAIVEVLPSSCGIAIAVSENVARAHLCLKIIPV
jgi:hypothetical protein